MPVEWLFPSFWWDQLKKYWVLSAQPWRMSVGEIAFTLFLVLRVPQLQLALHRIWHPVSDSIGVHS